MLKGIKAIVAVSVFSWVLGSSHGRPLGTAAQAATAAGCDLHLTSFAGLSLSGWRGGDKTFTASYLPNTTQILVQVAPVAQDDHGHGVRPGASG